MAASEEQAPVAAVGWITVRSTCLKQSALIHNWEEGWWGRVNGLEIRQHRSSPLAHTVHAKSLCARDPYHFISHHWQRIPGTHHCVKTKKEHIIKLCPSHLKVLPSIVFDISTLEKRFQPSTLYAFQFCIFLSCLSP